MQQIIVDVAPDGAVTIDAVGYAGADCEAATRFLEEALGQVAERQYKPEHRRPNLTRTRRQQRLGGKP